MSAPDSSTVVDVEAVFREFSGVRAVDGLSFRQRRGTILVLLGPNGAGKTTTIDLLEGFRRPDAGQIRVLGLDPWRRSAALRPRIGVMLQSGGAQASAPAARMLATVAACAERPQDPGWLLDVLGLAEVASTPVRRLSGGQAQRLNLAMALVGRPELLFLDEPTAGMDPQARHLVWDLLRAARSDGVSILMTTHLLDEAELLADDIVIMDHGRLLASGRPADLTSADHRELLFVTSSGLDLRPLRDALPEGFRVEEPSSGRYRVSGEITPGTVATVTSFCAAAGVLPTGVQVGGRSLEDVYLELTGGAVRA